MTLKALGRMHPRADAFSGRRIWNDYPYGDRPNWQRDSFNKSLNSPNRQ
jgi:hypothetical protein